MSNGLGARHSIRALVAGAVLTLSACSLLDVNNPNDISEDALGNPQAAGPMANGVEAAVSRALSAITTPYGVATDELDWIGSRDAWFDLETGAISNYLNEFTDQAFPFVGEARYLADATITRLEGFDQAGTLTDRSHLARVYIYAAIIYASIADMYDDFAFSDKTNAAAPVGRAAMGALYDNAIANLTSAEAIATALADDGMRYNILAYRARVRHAKAVWQKITPSGPTAPAAPLVNDAAANTDAAAAIALGTADQRFMLVSNVEAQPDINIWFEVNGRNEHQTGAVYRTLNDPVTAALDPTSQELLAEFDAYGSQDGAFVITSTRELRLILAEAQLAAGSSANFRTELNNVRALDAKTAFTGQAGLTDLRMLQHERQAQLWLMRRRLADMHRFGLRDSYWQNRPGYVSTFSCVGLLFPIPNVERLGNPNVTGDPSC